jgi:hypothetical protein
VNQAVIWLRYRWDSARGWQRWIVRAVIPGLAGALDELVRAMEADPEP